MVWAVPAGAFFARVLADEVEKVTDCCLPASSLYLQVTLEVKSASTYIWK